MLFTTKLTRELINISHCKINQTSNARQSVDIRIF